MNKKSLLLLAGLLIFVSSCYYDNEADLYALYNNGDCQTANISYSSTIQPLLNSQCISCHGSGLAEAGIRLDSYNAVIIQANNGKLYGTMAHSQGFSAMPPSGARIPACTLQQLQTWITAGTPNN